MPNFTPHELAELLESIEARFNKVLEERTRIHEDQHKEDHDWVTAQRLKDKARTELMQAATKVVMQLTVTGMVGGLITGVTWIYNHLNFKVPIP